MGRCMLLSTPGDTPPSYEGAITQKAGIRYRRVGNRLGSRIPFIGRNFGDCCNRGSIMMQLATRREFILTAAIASMAVGLDTRLAISAPVRLAQTPDPTPGFYRYKVGAAECTGGYDGSWEKAHDPALLQRASVAESNHGLAAAHLTTRFVPIPISALVVNLNGKLILCDAGGGGQVQPFNPQSVFVSGKMIEIGRASCRERVTNWAERVSRKETTRS